MKLLKIVESGNHRKGLYLCQCGTKKICNIDNVKPGRTVSCGCYKRNQMTKLGRASRTHGATGTIEHWAYIQARSRCSDVARKDYRHYGGRGIKFLYKSFEDFIRDIGKKPDVGMSLDRINNDDHYRVGNCRWATAKQQRNNQGPRGSHIS